MIKREFIYIAIFLIFTTSKCDLLQVAKKTFPDYKVQIIEMHHQIIRHTPVTPKQ